MSNQNLNLKDKNQVVQLFSEFEPLVKEHKNKELLEKTLDLLPHLNVIVDDKIIAFDSEETGDKYEKVIVLRIYTMHGMKIVVRLNDKGYITRWIEGISNCEVYCE